MKDISVLIFDNYLEREIGMSQNTFECYIDLSNKRPILRDKLTDKDILIVTHTKTDELKIRLFIDQIVHDSNEFEELFDKYGDIFIIVTGYQNNNSEHSNRIIVTVKNANGLNIHSSNDIDYESKATVSYIKQKNVQLLKEIINFENEHETVLSGDRDHILATYVDLHLKSKIDVDKLYEDWSTTITNSVNHITTES